MITMRISRRAFGILFAMSFFITTVAAFFKIMHWPFSTVLLVFGLLATLGYIVIGILEVNRSNRINDSEKFMWIIGFVFFSFIAAILYLLSGQRRVVN